jgi:transmembrane sensor
VRAEAALWLAHLRGPDRTPEVERGFREWLGARPENAVAFELASEVWERSAAVRRHPHEKAFGWTEARPWRGSPLFALAAVLAVIVISALYWNTARHGRFETAVGEQRALSLEDGSRLVLNTDTRVVVQYEEAERRIRLERGEALFEVARQPNRPFIVSVAGTQVQALGTSFVIKALDNDGGSAKSLQITLLDGKVAVTRGDTGESAPSNAVSAAQPQGQAVVLNPGERVTLAAHGPPRRDRPQLEKVTAWQRGQVAFDDVRLADAIAEMNRYSTTRLVVEQPDAAALRIGGVFRAADAASFAQAIAATYGLSIQEGDDTITLARK